MMIKIVHFLLACDQASLECFKSLPQQPFRPILLKQENKTSIHYQEDAR